MESSYETDSFADDQIVTYFLSLGLDFRDERGQPIRATIFLARQAEAACKGIAGQLPSNADADERDWAARLQKDALDFRKKRAG